MSNFDDLIAFGLGRTLFGGSTASERELDRQKQEQRHKELLDTMEANRLGLSLQQYRQRTARKTTRAIQDADRQKARIVAQNAGWWRESWFSKEIVVFGLKTEGREFSWNRQLVPMIGTKIRANKPFMNFDVAHFTVALCVPFSGSVIQRNQNAIEGKESIARGFWLLKIQLGEPKPVEMTASCPHCNGGVLVGEYGGQTVACPHCGQHMVLPSG